MYIYGPALEAAAPSAFLVWLRARSYALRLRQRDAEPREMTPT